MKRILIAAGCATVLALPAMAAAETLHAPAKPAPGPQRGAVVSVQPIESLSVKKTGAYFGQVWKAFDMGAPPKATHGVTAYRIVYRTIDAAGRPTTASGLLALPRTGAHRVRTVAYLHGTNPTKKAVASMTRLGDRAVSYLFASRGFGTIAPDYLGLGLGPGRHPYMHHASEATAARDLLRAAGHVAAGHGRTLGRKVNVTGFSQGGPAAMAFARGLQGERRLGALAPVSGPYAVEDAQLPEALHGKRLDPRESVFYLGYWTTAMNRLYGFYRSPSEAFRKPYDQVVERLFDGTHPAEEIARKLPASPDKLLTPAFARRLDAPTGRLADAMRDSDHTCGWAPRVPVRIYDARGDKEVSPLNSESCRLALRARGVRAKLIDVGNVQHNPSAFRAMPHIATWFAGLTGS